MHSGTSPRWPFWVEALKAIAAPFLRPFGLDVWVSGVTLFEPWCQRVTVLEIGIWNRRGKMHRGVRTITHRPLLAWRSPDA